MPEVNHTEQVEYYQKNPINNSPDNKSNDSAFMRIVATPTLARPDQHKDNRNNDTDSYNPLWYSTLHQKRLLSYFPALLNTDI